MTLRRVSRIDNGYYQDLVNFTFSESWINGSYSEKLSSHFKNLFPEHESVLTSYGIEALDYILDFYGFYNQDKILLVPVYTAQVIKDLLVERNVTYKLIDIDIKTGNISLNDLKDKIKDSHGILATHLLGNPLEQSIIQFIQNSDLLIIEDCAHAHYGLIDRNTPCGTIGHASFFSFDYSKLINGLTGGVLISKDLKLIEFSKNKISLLPPKTHFMIFKSLIASHIELFLNFKILFFLLQPILKNKSLLKDIKNKLNFFFNSRGKSVTSYFKLSNLQAYTILEQYKNMDSFLKRRKELVQLYINLLKNHFEIITSNDSSLYYFIINVKDSRKYSELLLDKGFDVGSADEIMQDLRTPNSNDSFDGISFALNHYLQLPIHQYMTTEKITSICNELIHIKQTNKEYSN